MGHSSSPQPFRVQATLELVLFPLGKATNAHERGKIIFSLQDGLLTGYFDCIASPSSRAPERWERWERVPSQFVILAATFG